MHAARTRAFGDGNLRRGGLVGEVHSPLSGEVMCTLIVLDS